MRETLEHNLVLVSLTTEVARKKILSMPVPTTTSQEEDDHDDVHHSGEVELSSSTTAITTTASTKTPTVRLSVTESTTPTTNTTTTYNKTMEDTPLSPFPLASPGTTLKVLLHRHDSEFSVDSRRYTSATSVPDFEEDDDDEIDIMDNEGEGEGDDDHHYNDRHAISASSMSSTPGGAATPTAATNDLNVWQGAALLTADCLGTGILALPHDIQVLGRIMGLSFLILNLPINYYAGYILAQTAHVVENKQHHENIQYQQAKKKLQKKQEKHQQQQDGHGGSPPTLTKSQSNPTMTDGNKNPAALSANQNYESIDIVDDDDGGSHDDIFEDELSDSEEDGQVDPRRQQRRRRRGRGHRGGGDYQNVSSSSAVSTTSTSSNRLHHRSIHHDTATFDFIGMTSALFHQKFYSRIVMVLFYTNIFLVLGDYILVMSHAVAALIGEDNICIPTAGLLASTLMFGVAQIRTMAKLGRAASIISLTALAVVVVQCLYHATNTSSTTNGDGGDVIENMIDDSNTTTITGNSTTSSFEASASANIPSIPIPPPSLLTRLAALGSIGFATGSQKLFLNIRHEFKNRNDAPKSLGISLTAFGSLYVLVCVLAGTNPPGFLFDAIPDGTLSRQIAGFLLWIHVVVSYAINSQAICASMDRLILSKMAMFEHWNDPSRWMLSSGVMAITAFIVANAIPFFKDLVALIGALTSVPLTLLLPALFYRQGILKTTLWKWSSDLRDTIRRPLLKNSMSYGLVIFSMVFMIAALLGSIDSIGVDWEHHTGGFFACDGS